jgi:hypothetical protein
MGTFTRLKAPETRGDRNLKAASLVLCSVLAGCASPWGNSAPSANSSPPMTPAVSQTAVPSPPPTALAAEAPPSSDGVHPNQTITEWFRSSSSPGSAPGSTNVANVPHPPSSYTPSGQPYTPPGQAYAPPGQPGYAAPQDAGNASTASETDSNGVYPSQSISDLFKH